MADSEGQKWLEEHMHRGERLIYVFYALGAFAVVSIAAEWKRPRAALPLAITTLALATGALGIGDYIAGGHIRHKEFRFEPAPELPTEEHHGGSDHAGRCHPFVLGLRQKRSMRVASAQEPAPPMRATMS
jgi:hypothetical protein